MRRRDVNAMRRGCEPRSAPIHPWAFNPYNDTVLSRGVASATASNYLSPSRGADGCSTLLEGIFTHSSSHQ